MIIDTYLNEELLGEFLCHNTNYHGEWVHNRKFYDSSYRPDYVNHYEKIVVEFDGYRHFSEFKTIMKDYMEDNYIISKGYIIIRIPYFVQLNSSEIIKYYFNQDLPKFNNYQHGFIDKNALLPFDFNDFGCDRYKNILKNLPDGVVDEILKSIRLKVDDEFLINWYLKKFM